MLMGCNRNDAVGRRELVPPLRKRKCGVASDGIGAQTRRKGESAYEAGYVLSLAASYSWTMELLGEKLAGSPRFIACMFAPRGLFPRRVFGLTKLTY